MDEALITEPIKTSHVVAVPYPGRGHINPLMNLCKLLTNSQPNLQIIFVITEEWFGIMAAEDEPPPPSIRLETIPNVLPSPLDRAKDMLSYVGAVQTKMADPVEKLLDRLGLPVNLIIYDTFLNWTVDLGNRMNIPVAALWPMPATVFSIVYNFDLLVRNGDHPFEVSERGEERVDYIPGISSIRLIDIPPIAYTKDLRLFRLLAQSLTVVPKAQYLLINSIYEFEPQAINALKEEFSFPVYTFGPIIPYLNLEQSIPIDNISHDPDIEWLTSQPQSSVLYISLGSFLSVTSAQMDEIADGLCESGVNFFYVARGEATRLQERCGDKGRVVSWCEQLKVLCHPSVGGFWTHCGWNSTFECIYAGVPIIAFPLTFDQTTNRKLIVEDWGIGVDAKKDLKSGELLRSGDIAKIVSKFMDSESDERKDMCRRSMELCKKTKDAIVDGGSSKTNLNSFLKDIIIS